MRLSASAARPRPIFTHSLKRSIRAASQFTRSSPAPPHNAGALRQSRRQRRATLGRLCRQPHEYRKGRQSETGLDMNHSAGKTPGRPVSTRCQRRPRDRHEPRQTAVCRLPGPWQDAGSRQEPFARRFVLSMKKPARLQPQRPGNHASGTTEKTMEVRAKKNASFLIFD